MKLSEQVKPISHLKAHAPEIMSKLKDNLHPVIITLHGEAKAILQDVGQYEETPETLALLKVLALTSRHVEEGKLRPAAESFARIRNRLADSQP
ncbi:MULTISPECIES: type II toxin-antitoxin system Phd/YefM family antitoxin [Rhizobium]|uniref:Antitoxin n=2 Tax=Rhizobium TaxID=379 RepID=Q1M7T0_RHIJ3|nr:MULTISPECIES: type II toxin-antitoxin system Phd/YefM family antitoxin [Rhizobium]MBY5323165.1 type II toxin-antitoxin system Phd/YefM family antitoxin [Rhizobium leguminosarum]MBY5384358.1 type II toxin-antitoxin system Phd/YefM family antitoxin [Rhizobium leguminosarum]MBY5391555.1 type II toxin-antitoxin system Phd/YefM family antitoxin [Rhizobium leguminosarum]MBY5415959.1 type II toxin-antitoxin system Phd/YefM family antitoxin [Rhizobium leguminosarum]MBY5433444.1 type II toxin-antito